MVWVEVVFMMLVLKIPVVYVGWLVWWAVRQEPLPPEGAPVTVRIGKPDAPARGSLRSRFGGLRPRGPHGRPRPARGYPRVARAAARASGRDGTVPR
jgi:hypothetical protein